MEEDEAPAVELAPAAQVADLGRSLTPTRLQSFWVNSRAPEKIRISGGLGGKQKKRTLGIVSRALLGNTAGSVGDVFRVFTSALDVHLAARVGGGTDAAGFLSDTLDNVRRREWNDMAYGARRNVRQADVGGSSSGCEEERNVGELHCG